MSINFNTDHQKQILKKYLNKKSSFILIINEWFMAGKYKSKRKLY